VKLKGKKYGKKRHVTQTKKKEKEKSVSGKDISSNDKKEETFDLRIFQKLPL
jgi:hypothetical protein